MINNYPLSWPAGWPRSKPSSRKHGQFKSGSSRIGIGMATGRILMELKRLGVSRDDIVISTNVQVRLDGLPRSDKEPLDPGAAVYWVQRGGRWEEGGNRFVKTEKKNVMAIDAYTKLADNLAAIAATLEAMRAIERHGGAQILERAFSGFTALPAPSVPWRTVLGIPPDLYVNRDDLDLAYKRARSAAHPDRHGGSGEAYNQVERAYEAGRAELGIDRELVSS